MTNPSAGSSPATPPRRVVTELYPAYVNTPASEARDGALIGNWALPVGNTGTQEPVYRVRDPRQRDAVVAIAARDDFVHACGNPFSADMVGRSYSGPFMFLWYDTSDRLHAARIGKTGKILRETIAP